MPSPLSIMSKAIQLIISLLNEKEFKRYLFVYHWFNWFKHSVFKCIIQKILEKLRSFPWNSENSMLKLHKVFISVVVSLMVWFWFSISRKANMWSKNEQSMHVMNSLYVQWKNRVRDSVSFLPMCEDSGKLVRPTFCSTVLFQKHGKTEP